jgi:hypothetical protein
MPSTYTLISSNVLSTSAASVTFSAIPSTYTDLVVRFSCRVDRAVSDSTVQIYTNVSGSVYSGIRLRGTGSAVNSATQSGVTSWQQNSINAGTSTANTFSSGELYIPNYLASANKPASYFQVMEDNSSSALIFTIANLLSSTTAISSITFDGLGFNLLTGSSFYLYGIAKS